MIRESPAPLICDNCGVMDLQIRPAGRGDAEIVAVLARITFVETFGHLFGNHENDLAAYLDHTFAVAKIRKSLGEPDNRYWIALRDGLPIGYAKLKHPSPTPLLPNQDPAQLQKIYILRIPISRDRQAAPRRRARRSRTARPQHHLARRPQTEHPCHSLL